MHFVNFISGYLSEINKDTGSKGCIISSAAMFTAALFTTAMIWKQLTCTRMNECKEDVGCVCVRARVYMYTHVTECYSDIKRIEILPFVTTEMERGHHAK